VVADARPDRCADIADVVDERLPDQIGQAAQVDLDVDRSWLCRRRRISLAWSG
jgi:hypothetical protein